MSDSSFLWRITTLSSLISLPCNSSCQLGMLSLDRVLNPCLIYFKYVVFFHGRWEVVFLEIYAIRGSCHVIQSGEIRWSQWSTYRFKKVLKGQVLSSKLLIVLEKEEYLIFLYIYISVSISISQNPHSILLRDPYWLPWEFSLSYY